MKKLLILICTASIVTLQSCDDGLTEPLAHCTEVKVITELCNQAVIQVINPESIQVELGSIEIDGVNYNNVFKTFFHCEQMPNVPMDGSVFRIKPISESIWRSLWNSSDDCVVCEPLLAGELPFSYVEIKENCSSVIAE